MKYGIFIYLFIHLFISSHIYLSLFIYKFIDTHFLFLSMKSEVNESQFLYAVKISLSISNK